MFISKSKLSKMEKDIKDLQRKVDMITEMYTQEILRLTNDLKDLQYEKVKAFNEKMRKQKIKSPHIRKEEKEMHFLEIIRLDVNKTQSDFSKEIGFHSIGAYSKIIHYVHPMRYWHASLIMNYLKKLGEQNYDFKKLDENKSFIEFMNIYKAKGAGESKYGRKPKNI